MPRAPRYVHPCASYLRASRRRRARCARRACSYSSSFGPLTGCHGARRGTYRIVYRIDENTRTVHVLDIDYRSDIYQRGPA